MQVPADGAMLHFIPTAHDDDVQQTPSTHVSPVLHSGVVAHVAPGPPVETQWFEASHLYPVAQSEIDVHVVRHAVGPHTYGVQGSVVGVLQLPLPSQYVVLVCVPDEHDAPTQTFADVE